MILLGGLGGCDDTRFGGTEYAKVVLNQLWGLPPALDMDYEKRVQAAVREIVAQGLAESAHDLSDGGLAVALAECSFGPAGVGARARSRQRPAAGVPALPRGPVAHPDLDRRGPARSAASPPSTACEALRGRRYHRAAGSLIRNRGETLIDCEVQPAPRELGQGRWKPA